MKLHHASSVAFALAFAPVAAASNAQYTFTGEAREDDSPVYEEHHAVIGECQDGRWRPATHTVEYRKPGESQPFATKSLDYKHSPLRPDMTFRQPDFEEVIEITREDENSLAILWQTPSGKTEEFQTDVDEAVVIDAGFDNLVRRHWENVTAAKSVDFRFLAPTRGEHYAFVMEPVSTDQTDAPHTVTIRPSGMVLRFLVDPITLGYDESGALTDYIGLSNIRKSEDGNFMVHIRYEVTERPECELTP
ncbi:MAG: hypothetical protein ACQEV6_06130 [Pseudomonadota bacterium]